MQKVSKGNFDDEVEIIHEEDNQKIREEALKSERVEKKAKDAEKKVTSAKQSVKIIKIKYVFRSCLKSYKFFR